MSFLIKKLRCFPRDDKGTITVEAVLIMPILIWALVAMFGYWGAFSRVNAVQKVSYTILDLVSRSQDSVDDAYINGMRSTMNYMLGSPNAGELRITSYTWSEADSRYQVVFSRSSSPSMPRVTNAMLATYTDRLPIMADGQSAILLETRVPYTPPTAYGMEPTTLEQSIVMRPRFLPVLCHVDEEDACNPAVPIISTN